MRKRRSVSIDFSTGELQTLRRFLNRALECSVGRCPGYKLEVTWYVVKPVMKKIEDALNQIKERQATENMVAKQQP